MNPAIAAGELNRISRTRQTVDCTIEKSQYRTDTPMGFRDDDDDDVALGFRRTVRSVSVRVLKSWKVMVELVDCWAVDDNKLVASKGDKVLRGMVLMERIKSKYGSMYALAAGEECMTRRTWNPRDEARRLLDGESGEETRSLSFCCCESTSTSS